MNEMLTSTEKPGWCRIAILRGGRLDVLKSEPLGGSAAGTIFKGRVDIVEPSIQSAFLNLGLPRRGFLHVTDVSPKLFAHLNWSATRKDKPPIESIFQPGQDIAVQIIRDGVGTKGPTLSTYLSIAGRYLILMPGLDRSGVTRTIENDEERQRLLAIVKRIAPPGLAFIVRAAGVGRSEEELSLDLNWLAGTWRSIADRLANLAAPSVAFQECGPIQAALRDVFAPDIDVLWLDDRAMHAQVQGIVAQVFPGRESCILLHEGAESLFATLGLPDEPAH